MRFVQTHLCIIHACVHCRTHNRSSLSPGLAMPEGTGSLILSAFFFLAFLILCSLWGKGLTFLCCEDNASHKGRYDRIKVKRRNKTPSGPRLGMCLSLASKWEQKVLPLVCVNIVFFSQLWKCVEFGAVAAIVSVIVAQCFSRPWAGKGISQAAVLVCAAVVWGPNLFWNFTSVP